IHRLFRLFARGVKARQLPHSVRLIAAGCIELGQELLFKFGGRQLDQRISGPPGGFGCEYWNDQSFSIGWQLSTLPSGKQEQNQWVSLACGCAYAKGTNSGT